MNSELVSGFIESIDANVLASEARRWTDEEVGSGSAASPLAESSAMDD